MARRKAKNARKCDDPVVLEKLRKLEKLTLDFKASCTEYETNLESVCIEKCNRIHRLYMDKLNSIPEHIRNMTIAQFMEYQEKEKQRTAECPKDEEVARSQFERTKMMSEKKKTLKKEKKRSLSASAAKRPLVVSHPPVNRFSRLSRAISDSALATPSMANRLSNMVVTPKFNPKIPVSHMARVPKPGELVMSMSGSPLQNLANDNGKITLSLGQGKILTFNEESDVEKEIIKGIDEPTKKIIKNLKEKLDKILQE